MEKLRERLHKWVQKKCHVRLNMLPYHIQAKRRFSLITLEPMNKIISKILYTLLNLVYIYVPYSVWKLIDREMQWPK